MIEMLTFADFRERLSPEARRLHDDPWPRRMSEYDGYLVSIKKLCQAAGGAPHPWYEETLALVLNHLVAAGAVQGLVAVGGVCLPAGRQEGPRGETDVGPDENACVFLTFWSCWSPDKINRHLGNECACLEVDSVVGNTDWGYLREDPVERLWAREVMVRRN